MGEHDDVRVLRLLFEVGREPLQLLVADQRARIGYVVQGDEVHALVVEGVVGLAKELLVGLAAVE